MIQAFIIVLVVFSGYLFFLIKKNSPENRRKFLFFCGIGIVLVYSNVSMDIMFADIVVYYKNYLSIATKSYQEMLFSTERDYGYYTLIWCLTRISDNFRLLCYVERGFLVIVTFLLINRYCERPFISVIFLLSSGIFTFYMSAFRQCFAFCFCLLAYMLMEVGSQRHSKIRTLFAIGLFLVSLSMHISAIVFAVPLFMILLGKGHKEFKYFLLALFFIAVVYFRDQIVDESEVLLGKGYKVGSGVAVLGGVIQIVIFVFPLVILFLTKNSQIRLKSFSFQRKYELENLMSMLWIGIVFYALRFTTQSYERLAVYFTVAGAPLYGNMLDTLEQKDRKAVSYIVTLLLVTLFVYRSALKT